MTKAQLQPIRPLLIIFVFISAFAITGRSFLLKKGINPDVLLFGNLLLFSVTFGAYYVNLRSQNASSPQAPVRAMYAGFMIKFFVLALAAFIYIMLAKKQVNIPALLLCAALYIIYTSIETKALLQLTKRKKDA